MINQNLEKCKELYTELIRTTLPSLNNIQDMLDYVTAYYACILLNLDEFNKQANVMYSIIDVDSTSINKSTDKTIIVVTDAFTHLYQAIEMLNNVESVKELCRRLTYNKEV